jgi:hypothetical protein
MSVLFAHIMSPVALYCMYGHTRDMHGCISHSGPLRYLPGNKTGLGEILEKRLTDRTRLEWRRQSKRGVSETCRGTWLAACLGYPIAWHQEHLPLLAAQMKRRIHMAGTTALSDVRQSNGYHRIQPTWSGGPCRHKWVGR